MSIYSNATMKTIRILIIATLTINILLFSGFLRGNLIASEIPGDDEQTCKCPTSGGGDPEAFLTIQGSMPGSNIIGSWWPIIPPIVGPDCALLGTLKACSWWWDGEKWVPDEFLKNYCGKVDVQSVCWCFQENDPCPDVD